MSLPERPFGRRWPAMAIAASAWLLGPAAIADEAGPIEGHLAVFALPPFGDIPNVGSHSYWDVGVEAEFGPRHGFWSVGSSAWIGFYPEFAWTPWDDDVGSTTWGRLRWEPAPGHEFSLLGGYNYRYSLMACAGTCEPYTPYGLLVGASWRYRSDRFWVRVTPQYTFALFGDRQRDGWMLSNVPWVEVAYRLTPQLDLGFRLGPAPIKLTWNF